MKYAYIIIAAVIAAIITLILLLVIDRSKSKKNSKIYLQMLTELYDNGETVINSLEKIKATFKKGSIQFIAIDHAVFYLNKSIMRDYETAFSIIEKVFSSNEVKLKHAAIIEKEKANVIFLLQ
jgi:hypothetical protein